MTRPQNASERLKLRQCYIPKGARPILEHTNESAWYNYEVGSVLYGISFWGTSAKPLSHYRYRNEEARNAAIQQFRESVEHSVTRKATTRAQKAAWTNPLVVGDILYTSWGYDQTNTEFYAVTRISGKRVWIREIAADYEQTGFMSGKSWPAMPIRFVGEETMHIAQSRGGGASLNGEKDVMVKIDHHYAWPEQGRSHYTSSYA